MYTYQWKHAPCLNLFNSIYFLFFLSYHLFCCCCFFVSLSKHIIFALLFNWHPVVAGFFPSLSHSLLFVSGRFICPLSRSVFAMCVFLFLHAWSHRCCTNSHLLFFISLSFHLHFSCLFFFALSSECSQLTNTAICSKLHKVAWGCLIFSCRCN